jgi:hypothetical protein
MRSFGSRTKQHLNRQIRVTPCCYLQQKLKREKYFGEQYRLIRHRVMPIGYLQGQFSIRYGWGMPPILKHPFPRLITMEKQESHLTSITNMLTGFLA